MQSWAAHLHPWFHWLLHTTWQAGVLVGLILLVQRTLGRRLGVRGRYWLWLVLLVRMAMPWAPQSGASLYNLLPALSLGGSEVGAGGATDATPSALRGTSAKGAAHGSGSMAERGRRTRREHSAESSQLQMERRIVIGLSLIWSAGVLGLTICVAVGGVRVRRIIRRGRPVADPQVIGVLDDCRRRMGIRTAVTMVATNEAHCPALCGILRPRLLLPERTLSESDGSSLAHIFLHELAHLKRRDILVGHAASLLHVLHWFNPLIAVALRRMRADRELACDAMALSALHPDEAIAYGHTILQQAERLLAFQPRWTPAALCGDKTKLRERIVMISRFRAGQYRWSPMAAILVGGLACVGLTERLAGGESGVEPPATAWEAYARGDFFTTHQDSHTNIQRCCIRNLETGQYLVLDGEKVTCADEPGEAGLWEFRFDEVSNTAESFVYLYSVSMRRYLTSDDHGNLAVNASEPIEAARWGFWPRPEGVWVISHHFKDGYLRADELGPVSAVNFGRDARGYWDIHAVWRIKTSDDPESNPQWQREHVPGPL